MRAANGQFVKGSHWRRPALHWDAAWLRNEYEQQGRSAADIARDAGTTENAILYWLTKHSIPRRSMSQARALKHWGVAGEANPMHGRKGEANPRYVGGSSPERQRQYAQGIGRAFIRDVLQRDGYRCVRCGAKKTGKGSLHVHHLKAWAGNPALRFDHSNAVTLCRSCHAWVHSNNNKNKEFLQ